MLEKIKHMDLILSRGPTIQKPWILLNKVRSYLEKEFNCSTAELMRSHLVPYFSAKVGQPVTVGSAHISGNLYLGFPSGGLSGTQSLVCNVFTHGEVGIDFIALADPKPQFTAAEENLLSQLGSFRVLRVEDGSEIKPRKEKKKDAATPSSSSSSDGKPTAEEIKEIEDLANCCNTSDSDTSTKRWSGFRSFPKAQSLFTHNVMQTGNLLQHDAYLDSKWELEGENEDEWIRSMARYMRYQSYPAGEEHNHVGVAAMYQGKAFGGSVIPNVAPIQMLGTALLANGVHPTQVERVCFTGKIDERIRGWNPNAEIFSLEESKMSM